MQELLFEAAPLVTGMLGMSSRTARPSADAFPDTFAMSTIRGEAALDRKIDRIVAFNNWPTSSGNIMQVSYAALMANGQQARTSSESKALTDWNLDASTAEKARITAADKGQVFQIASNTAALRNQMP